MFKVSISKKKRCYNVKFALHCFLYEDEHISRFKYLHQYTFKLKHFCSFYPKIDTWIDLLDQNPQTCVKYVKSGVVEVEVSLLLDNDLFLFLCFLHFSSAMASQTVELLFLVGTSPLLAMNLEDINCRASTFLAMTLEQ